MLRKILTIVLLCAGLLSGLPAFACAATMPAKDCCPPGQEAPCHTGRESPARSVVATPCCVSAQTAIASIALPRLMHIDRERNDANSPPVANAAHSFIFLPAFTTHIFAPDLLQWSRTGAQLYLSTGRLRL